jgi:AraC family transcriptional regulator, regulatory protein of adaptative response / methylated-DNA-[protein]-cysteine methyltransferase
VCGEEEEFENQDSDSALLPIARMLGRMTDEERWQCVIARDESSEAFVYAVRTTGVYCRPSCPARRPKRGNVQFFAAAADAERSGFRACRRCWPAAEVKNRGANLARRVCEYIRDEIEAGSSPGLMQLAAAFGMSAGHLQRSFTKAIGVSPATYAQQLRIRQLKSHLRAGETVTDAMYEAGFNGSSRLYESAGKSLGMTPGAYRRKGRGMQIGYVLADTPFGRMLFAATDRGLSALYLGGDDDFLIGSLREEYPEAVIRPGSPALQEHADRVVSYLAGRGGCPDVEYDLRATAFQLRVWEKLREIPPGATKTYRQVASELEMPSGSRAVARACATNPVSVLTPCHRVIRGDGKLAGYRWGLERKKALLDWEQKLGKDRDTQPEQ